MLCFEDTSQDTCVIHNDTQPLYPIFTARLFNASISTADIIMLRIGGCGVYCNTVVGRDCVVGIATRCGLDGTRIASRWGRDFPHPSRPALRPTHSPYGGYRVSFPRIKWPGRGVDHPPAMSAKVKERVEVYLFCPFWAFIAGYRVNFALILLQ